MDRITIHAKRWREGDPSDVPMMPDGVDTHYAWITGADGYEETFGTGTSDDEAIGALVVHLSCVEMPVVIMDVVLEDLDPDHNSYPETRLGPMGLPGLLRAVGFIRHIDSAKANLSLLSRHQKQLEDGSSLHIELHTGGRYRYGRFMPDGRVLMVDCNKLSEVMDFLCDRGVIQKGTL